MKERQKEEKPHKILSIFIEKAYFVKFKIHYLISILLNNVRALMVLKYQLTAHLPLSVRCYIIMVVYLPYFSLG